MRSPQLVLHTGFPRDADAARTDAAPFAADAGETFEFDQPRRTVAAWELHRGGDAIARLARAHWWGTRHVIDTPRGRWWVNEGWLGRAELRRDGETSAAARYQAGWLFNGRVWLADGVTLRWRRIEWGVFWHGAWELRTEEEFPILRFRLRRGFLRVGGTIEIVQGAVERPGLEEALLLGWYLALATTRRHSQ
jgi:hypothetical protein